MCVFVRKIDGLYNDYTRGAAIVQRGKRDSPIFRGFLFACVCVCVLALVRWVGIYPDESALKVQ